MLFPYTTLFRSRESEVEPVVLAGIVSFTTTPGGTVDGPLFVNRKSTRLNSSHVAIAYPALFAREKTADLVTVSVSDALLLAVLGSETGLLSIVAVLVRVVPG